MTLDERTPEVNSEQGERVAAPRDAIEYIALDGDTAEIRLLAKAVRALREDMEKCGQEGRVEDTWWFRANREDVETIVGMLGRLTTRVAKLEGTACERCGHPNDWHRHDDATESETFRCLGYDCDAPAGGPDRRCDCPDYEVPAPLLEQPLQPSLERSREQAPAELHVVINAHGHPAQLVAPWISPTSADGSRKQADTQRGHVAPHSVVRYVRAAQEPEKGERLSDKEYRRLNRALLLAMATETNSARQDAIGDLFAKIPEGGSITVYPPETQREGGEATDRAEGLASTARLSVAGGGSGDSGPETSPSMPVGLPEPEKASSTASRPTPTPARPSDGGGGEERIDGATLREFLDLDEAFSRDEADKYHAAGSLSRAEFYAGRQSGIRHIRDRLRDCIAPQPFFRKADQVKRHPPYRCGAWCLHNDEIEAARADQAAASGEGERDGWDDLVRGLQEAEVTTRWLAWHSDAKQQARTKKKAGDAAGALDGALTSVESQLVWALTEPDLREIIASALRSRSQPDEQVVEKQPTSSPEPLDLATRLMLYADDTEHGDNTEELTALLREASLHIRGHGRWLEPPTPPKHPYYGIRCPACDPVDGETCPLCGSVFTPAPESQDGGWVGEVAWLIERGKPEGFGQTRWYWAEYQVWTDDANKATRFPSRAEAESVIRDHSDHPNNAPIGRAIDHQFLRRPNAPAPVSQEPVDDDLGSVSMRNARPAKLLPSREDVEKALREAFKAGAANEVWQEYSEAEVTLVARLLARLYGTEKGEGS